jgi:hypothetical protein
LTTGGWHGLVKSLSRLNWRSTWLLEDVDFCITGCTITVLVSISQSEFISFCGWDAFLEHWCCLHSCRIAHHRPHIQGWGYKGVNSLRNTCDVRRWGWMNVKEAESQTVHFLRMNQRPDRLWSPGIINRERQVSRTVVVMPTRQRAEGDNNAALSPLTTLTIQTRTFPSTNTTGASVTWSGQIVFKRRELKRGQQTINSTTRTYDWFTSHNTIRALWPANETQNYNKDQFEIDNWSSTTKDVGTRHRAELFFS